MLTLESFEQASEIVKQVTQETKLIKSSYFSELTGNSTWCLLQDQHPYRRRKSKGTDRSFRR